MNIYIYKRLQNEHKKTIQNFFLYSIKTAINRIFFLKIDNIKKNALKYNF